jgi:hypothetical protein
VTLLGGPRRALVAAGVALGAVFAGGQLAASPETVVTPLAEPAVATVAACRLGPAGGACGEVGFTTTTTIADLSGCPDADRAAVVDKAAQRFWLCADGVPSTAALPMTSASAEYGLPPVGTHHVFDKDALAFGLHGERLERFVAFYTTPRGNRIAFHQYVSQDESTIGDLDQRGDSSGCLRVSTADSWLVWNLLQVGDPVVVVTN